MKASPAELGGLLFVLGRGYITGAKAGLALTMASRPMAKASGSVVSVSVYRTYRTYRVAIGIALVLLPRKHYKLPKMSILDIIWLQAI